MIIFLFYFSSLFADKERVRQTYPEIWEKLQQIEYAYSISQNFKSIGGSFPLENKREILYPVSQHEEYLWSQQNLSQRAFLKSQNPIC